MFRTRFCPMTARPIRPISHKSVHIVSPFRASQECPRPIHFFCFHPWPENPPPPPPSERKQGSLFRGPNRDRERNLQICSTRSPSLTRNSRRGSSREINGQEIIPARVFEKRC